MIAPEVEPLVSGDEAHREEAHRDEAHRALVALGRALIEAGYEFTTVTPATQARVLAREEARGRGVAASLRDVFGWNQPFPPELLPSPMLGHLERAGAIVEADGLRRATIRFSTLGGRLFVHSGFPTDAPDAVFFGPDTVRFHRLLERVASRADPAARRAVDVGCGSGAGGLALSGAVQSVVLADINARALAMAGVNAELAGVDVELVESDVLAGVDGELDLVVANPPYLRDDGGRTYREGGGSFGEGLSVRIVAEAVERLAPGGRVVLYSGAAVVDGVDRLRQQVEPVLEAAGASYRYWELDPDVFGEELERPAYDGVDRLAAVALVATVP